MSFLYLPAMLTSVFGALGLWLHVRTAARLPFLLLGILFARGRRTVTSWFRAGGISDDFRQGYVTVCAVGKEADCMAVTIQATVQPLLDPKRLLVGIDDTPTARYGPFVEGAGIHHNPTPGPAGEKHVYGHIWVILAALAKHKDWDTIALPYQAQLYIRKVDVENLPPERPRAFRTKLEMALEQLRWLQPQVQGRFEELWAAVDGGYAKRPFLIPARKDGWIICSRLRKDAQLWDLPPAERKAGQRGPMPTYGKNRICLAKRAGQKRGWQEVECVQYGETLTKTIKTFQATYRPAGGIIRVVLVREEEDRWVPFFCVDPDATAEEILETMAGRGALEQMNKDVKEVWGAGQQQVRNLDSNIGCFNLNLWMHSLIEAWAWDQQEENLVDRSASPWDSEPRRPSHQDKRKALQREVLRAEIEAVLTGQPTDEAIRGLIGRLLELAV
jgi:hypothetical protein